jgi:hypothetical protein
MQFLKPTVHCRPVGDHNPNKNLAQCKSIQGHVVCFKIIAYRNTFFFHLSPNEIFIKKSIISFGNMIGSVKFDFDHHDHVD